jgi:hypothetical protein
VLVRDVADQLHQRHGLAHAGATEQADLAALGDRHDQVDDLDTGFEQLCCRCLVLVARRRTVDRHLFLCADVALVVDRPAEYVHDTAQRLFADGHGNRPPGIGDRHASLEALR